MYKHVEDDLMEDMNSMQHDKTESKKEVVFLPYKASMWDSLESVWMAAKEDKDCEVYVIPIPYYDKNPDGSFREEHYEGELYPDYVPITHYSEYDIEKHHPDMIYIHNPYDNSNYVTSVHPYFYSENLKQFTELLVYIPYYSTTGGMMEGQKDCPAYNHADYIIIQQEKYRRFFDENIPAEKLLPLGTPKFDRVIRICNNPPEPSAEWKEKMAGKKVYFYNTSLNGMLNNTPVFLRKMEYVFRCFLNREDACLLWRPHPLMESTFDSMRAAYKPFYEALKSFFIKSNLGIYDDTPDITASIALCDAYIGDSGTSVTSLFGIAGKPVFILDNNINTNPEADDWKGNIIQNPFVFGNYAWMVTQGNKLYHSPESDYQYKFCCDLSEYAYGNYYYYIISIGEKNYVCPISAQNILMVNENGIERKIELERLCERSGAFYGAISCGKYLCLIPNNYPAIVRYDTENDEIAYFPEYHDVYVKIEQGQRKTSGYCVLDGKLYIASPSDNEMVVLNVETGEIQKSQISTKSMCGCALMTVNEDEIWLLPYSGSTVIRWETKSGKVQEYMDWPQGLKCKHSFYGYECVEKPFGYPAFCGEYVYFPPSWGNMYVRLNKNTGEAEEWHMPFSQLKEIKNGYYLSWSNSYFLINDKETENSTRYLFSNFDRKLYEVNLETNAYKEIEIGFIQEELRKNEAGFFENSEWLQYACEENVFNTLIDFLNDNIKGNQFDKERQMKAYGTIAANHDGTSGEKIYQYMCRQLEKK